MYLRPSETIQTRKTKSKNMSKVMFLIAVSNPRMDVKRGKFFNGNIGCYPLMEEIQATRNSKIETKVRLTFHP